MIEQPYHSANLPQVGAKPLADCAAPEGSAIFVHDIMTSDVLPAAYDDAGAIYADLPWAKGFATFNKRAGVKDGRTYAQFLGRVDHLAATAERPVFIVTSATAAKSLTGRRFPIQLDRPGAGPVPAVVVAYNTVAPLERTTSKLLDRLAREWITIGDFCCGYGTTVRAAMRNNTYFVASDYSAEAIGYVCANYQEWT